MLAPSDWIYAASKERSHPKGAWQPPDEDRSAFRDIIDFNIFRSDRRRLADDVDRKRNPPPPRDTTPTQVVEDPEEPKDPDASWRLCGISHDADGSTAYLEHTETGELAKIMGEDDFSAGRISELGYETLVYTVDETRRVIYVGETLLGQRERPAITATSGSSSTSDKPASLEDRLRALRERRAREQGETPPPAVTPEQENQPKPTPKEENNPATPRAESAT